MADAVAPSGSMAASESAWEQVVPGGECGCADGSEFSFWAREADPTKVVFYLDGGGACLDAETCAFTERTGDAFYDWNVDGENPAVEGGMFDLDHPANPFAGYSFIYVPSCTGDMHLGDKTYEYSPELTVEHNGFVNGSAALSYLAEHFPDATEIVVVGKTAGGFPRLSTADWSATCFRTPASRCSPRSRAGRPTPPSSLPRSSANSGAPTARCPTGRSTRG